MVVIKFLLISSLLLVFAWAGVSKIILEDLDRYFRTYKKVNTLYYRKLQDLQNRIYALLSIGSYKADFSY